MSDKQILLADPDTLILQSPYDPAEVKDTKRVTGARWDRVRRVWTFPISSLPQVTRLARKHGIWMDATLASVKLPEHPVGEARLELASDHIRIVFPHDPIMIAAVKQVPGAVFEKKKWRVPLTSIAEVKVFAGRFNVEVPEDQKAELAAIEEEVTRESRKLKAMSTREDGETVDIPGFVGELMPFQRAGVNYILETRRTFVADEMGLGKTVQAIAAIEAADEYPALIVCPPSLTLNWEKEWNRFAPARTTQVVAGRQGELDAGLADVTVIGDAILDARKGQLKEFASVVFDESHRFKNFDAKRTKAAIRTAKGKNMVLCLTGTPITNRPAEYAAQLDILGHLGDYGGRWPFYKRYAGAFKDRFGQWNISGAAHLDELNERLRSTCYVRRVKSQVMTELAPVRDERLWVEGVPSVMKKYAKAEDDIIEFVAQRAAELAVQLGKPPGSAAVHARIRAESAEHLVRLAELRQLAAQAKLPAALEWVEERVEAGLSVVVAAHHRPIVDELAAAWGDVKIQGGMSTTQVEANKQAFQDGEAPVIVVSIAAGGVGHTLTRAQDMLFVEHPWTPADLDQMVARIHRKGQDGSVLVTHMLTDGTMDADMLSLLGEKRRVVDAATEGGEVARGGSVQGDLLVGFLGRG